LRSAPRGVKLRAESCGDHDGSTADGASTAEPHGAASAGHGGLQALPIKWAGGCGMGGRAGGPEDGPGRRLRRGHPALQDGGSDGEEAERREGGSSSASSLRGADLRGGKLGGHDGPTADGASTPPHGAASAGHGGSQALPIKWVGGCGMGGRAGGPEAGFSRPQASGRPPGLISSTAAITTTGWTSSGWEQVAERQRSQAARRKAAGTTRALPPMERVRRSRTELHRRGTAARRPSSSKRRCGPSKWHCLLAEGLAARRVG